jgi:octaprenyl-diphosphate synthase
VSSDIKAKIISRAAPDLEAVEKALAENLAPNYDLVKEIASHLLFAGGKRLRPLLMIHSARMCGYEDGFEILFSTIFEYLHAATLLHDDVVDGAAIRRGKKAAHTLWEPAKVVLTGDFLLARALDIAGRTQSPKVISVIAAITEAMSQGEIIQMENKGRTDLTESEYNEIIERKTAVLIQGACQSGAIVAGGSEEKETALKDYGYHLGMAFQMADDLLDYTATAQELGKNPGADLREGKLTLPLIYSLANAGPEDKAFMLEAMDCKEFDPEIFTGLKNRLQDIGGISYTQKRADRHVAEAISALGGFDPSPSKELLTLIAEYAILRKV